MSRDAGGAGVGPVLHLYKMLILDMGVSTLFFVGVLVFFISFVGAMLNTHNFVLILICLDIMLLSCAFGFIVSAIVVQNAAGYFYALFLLVVAASETAIGLGLLILLFQLVGRVDLVETAITRG